MKRKKITRRAVLGGGASAVATPAAARAFPKLLTAGSTPLPAQSITHMQPLGGAFITAINSFGTSNVGNTNASYGYGIIVGDQNISVTSMARWIFSGNNNRHTLQILNGALPYVVVSVTLNARAFSANAWAYLNLSSPVTLAANTKYFIVCSEPDGDTWSQVNHVTTATGATLIGGAYNTGSGWNLASDGEAFSLVNFQFIPTSSPATLGGSPFPPLGRALAAVGVYPLQVATGKTTVDVSTVDTYNISSPPLNSMVVQWFLDGHPYGPQILGPLQDASNAGLPHWPITIDTTILTDGTHSIFPQVIDSGRNGGYVPGYLFLGYAQNLIVQNSGPLNEVQSIPVNPTPANSYQYPPMPEFITYNGNTTRSVSTFNYPMPTVPPVTDPSSMYHNNPMALTNPAAYYVIDLVKNKFREFESDPSIVTTTSGGVLVGGTQTEAGNAYTFDMVSRVLSMVPWAGGRYDSRVSAYVTWIAEWTDNGWIGADHMGRVIWTDLTGNTTVIVGIELDRTQLPYHEAVNRALASDVLRLVKFHTIGNLASGGSDINNWGGLNGICQDPRNQHRLYVSNPLWNYILKIDMSTTPATYTRVAGLETSSGGYSGDGGDPLNALFNQPYSIIMTSDGVLLIGDRGNSVIRTLTTNSNGDPLVLSSLVGNQTNKPTEAQVLTADSGVVNGQNVNWNPAGSVSFTPGNTTTEAYVNFPQTIKFAANKDGSITIGSNNAKVVIYESDSNTVRMLDLAANTVTRMFQFEQSLRSNLFSWFDIDIYGACMPVNYMMFAHHNLNYTLCSPDGSSVQDWYGNVAPFGCPGVFWPTGITEGPIDNDPALVLDPNQAAYPWGFAFAKNKAMFMISGFRENAFMVWRATLPTDPNPQMPQSSRDLFGTGSLMWNYGTCLGFPRGIRPSLAALHGSFGFGHIGSDLGKTNHDVCVAYNGGTAAYNGASDNEALLNSVFLDPTTTTGMGVTKRPELNIESTDWQALSFFVRRSTTEGTYPTPALPGPTPTPTPPARISNVVITRLSFSSFQVTWNTDKPAIGIACCGSDINYNLTFQVTYYSPSTQKVPYSAWSAIEPAFTTSHSAMIPWGPMSIPTHVAVVVKDKTGNFSYSQDFTVGIHADGTVINGGTGLTANNTTKLVNNWGEWSLREEISSASASFYYVTLNGRLADSVGLPGGAQQLRIDRGGFLWAQTTSGQWFAWINGSWWHNGGFTLGPADPPFSIPAAINPPFVTLTDRSSVTSSSGSLSNEYGFWAINGSGQAALNNILLSAGFGNSPVGVSQIQINAHGQTFLQLSSDSSWRVWIGNRLNSAIGPTSAAIPLDIKFSRASVSIPHGSVPGTVMATVGVTMSDGSAFSGSYTVGLDGGGHQTGQMSGNSLQYGPFTYGSAQTISFLITATQNGCSFAVSFTEQLT